MIGKTIGNYKVTDRLGAGGMGEVFRARDTKLDRDVAIKMLPQGVAADAERLSRFEREAKLLAGLNHPNIAAIYGVEEADGATYLVLELVDGEDLSKRLDGGPVPAEEAIEIAQQIAEALEAAHEQGVIHRDLKPANVVLTAEGQAKILDFGLAKALDTDSSTSAPNLSNSPTVLASSPTLAGVVLGTAAYMSPEQARGKRVDKRADIFAFGVVLWEMLTGRQLFVGETVSDTLAAVLRHEPDFDELPPETHPALRRLVERCLEKDARARLRDIGEARITLGDIASGKAGAGAERAAGGPGFLRQYGGWIATGIVVVGSLIMMSTIKSGNGPGASGGSTADIPLRKFTIPLDPDDPSVVSGFKANISPDGRYIIYPRQGQLWARALTGTEAHPITGSDNASRPFWSPDGTEIAFGDGSGLFRVPREGGHRVTIGNFPTGIRMAGAASGAWTADGRIMMGSSTDGLFEVSARGGTIREVLRPREGETDFHQICALPEGKGWMIVIHDSSGIGTIDAVTPDLARHRLLHVDDMVRDIAWSPSGHVVFRRSGGTPGLWAFPLSLDPIEATGEPFLVAAGAQSPSVSRDGTLVYTRGIGDALGQITILDRTGNVVKTVGPSFSSARPFPRFSPDGRSIFIAENVGESREIFHYDIVSGNRRRVTFDDRRDDMVTFFPGNNEIITYESNSWSSQRFYLDGSADPQSIEDAIMTVVTSDGSTLVYARQRPDEWAFDIWARPADGSAEPTLLVGSEAVNWFPQISPDGKYLLYMSNETGEEEVFMTTFPRPSTRWEVSADGGAWPRWRPDGTEIYYVVENRLIAVDVSYDRGITLGTPQELFTMERVFWSSRWPDGFDISPDGKTFAVVQPVRDASDGAPAIVVVQNWWAEFEQE